MFYDVNIACYQLTEEVSLIKKNSKSTVKKTELNFTLLLLTHHNRMVWSKERIGQSCPV